MVLQASTLKVRHCSHGTRSEGSIMRRFSDHLDQAYKIFYMVVMPIVIIFLLLGLSSIIPRKMLLGNGILDLIVRLLLTMWYCTLYIRWARISDYSIYPNVKWSKDDVVDPIEKIIYISVGIFISTGVTIITWWTAVTFLSLAKILGLVVAVLNGIITLYPLIKNYWVLKM